MAASLIDGVGLISGALGIVGFIQDNIPDKPPQGANIRVKLGLGDDDNHGNVRSYPPSTHNRLSPLSAF